MQPYQNYYQPYQNQYQQALQNQIQNLQNQQAQYQAMLSQQPIQATQSISQVPTQVVDDFTNVQVANVPMDANGALFIKNDRSEIQTKHWTADGKLITTSYFPQIDNGNPSQEEIKLQNDTFNEFTDTLNEKINTLLDRMDILEEFITSQKQPKRATKKEVVDNE